MEFTKRNKNKLLALEVDVLRKTFRVSRVQHFTNIKIKDRMAVKETIMNEIDKKCHKIAR